MKILKVQGKTLRDESFYVTSVKDIETGLEINTPSTLINLLNVRKKLREPELDNEYFDYRFPISFAPRYADCGFTAEFPLNFCY